MGEPTRTENFNGHIRKVWVDAKGRDVIETFSIQGMGHGVPLATKSDSPVGKAAPYMLEAGISSTVRIAHSWGLATDADIAEAETTSGTNRQESPDAAASIIERALRHARPKASAAAPDGKITRVINDALRAAGLMR